MMGKIMETIVHPYLDFEDQTEETSASSYDTIP